MRETSDMVMVLPTENTKGTKIKTYMKSESIEPQNTQKCAENNSCSSCHPLATKKKKFVVKHITNY